MGARGVLESRARSSGEGLLTKAFRRQAIATGALRVDTARVLLKDTCFGSPPLLSISEKV